jgi:hypothetical protein
MTQAAMQAALPRENKYGRAGRVRLPRRYNCRSAHRPLAASS